MGLLEKTALGVRLMVGRAIINLVNDAGLFQEMQVDRLADETADDLERFGNYGFTSRPHAGAEVIVLSVGGVRSNGVIIACEDRRYRMTGLEGGEVAIYDDLGQVVHFKRDRLTLTSPTALEINAPQTTVTGDTMTFNGNDFIINADVTIGQDLNVTGDSVLGAGATKFVKLADDTISTKVKAK